MASKLCLDMRLNRVIYLAYFADRQEARRKEKGKESLLAVWQWPVAKTVQALTWPLFVNVHEITRKNTPSGERRLNSSMFVLFSSKQ